MGKLAFLLFSTLVLNVTYAQGILIKKWDYRYGGTLTDALSYIQKTSDGGYILGGSSNSNISGDKSEDNWGSTNVTDYWIVKIDSMGQKEWDRDFGGTGHDILVSCQETKDGGFILGGSSFSDRSGDKSDDNVSLAPWMDYWIIKINSEGEKEWDKTIGGLFSDFLTTLQLTADGGYILGGYSESPASGDKTDENWGDIGYYDYWIVKVDSLGVKEWDKTIGGTGEDNFRYLQQTVDGGYILGGYSNSGISGNKSQDIWGGSGDSDYWIVKIDAIGNIVWDKDYGGTGIDLLHSLIQTSDGGYILAGSSNSNISGNKTEETWGDTENYDYWILKINSVGEIDWDRDFGGTKDEEFGNISEISNGGYLISGTSYSPISGQKTENNLGEEQTWVIKLTVEGDLVWDKTLKTNSPVHDEVGLGIQVSDSCYVMANWTAGGIGGDKTQPNLDTTTTNYVTPDYWIIKFCESGMISNIYQEVSYFQVESNPNPFIDGFSVSFNNTNWKEAALTLFNVFGDEVYHSKFENTLAVPSKMVDVPYIPSGLYFLCMNIDGHPIIRKIIKY